MSNTLTRGILKDKEAHPAALSAMRYIMAVPLRRLYEYQEAYSGAKLNDNRLAEVCSKTLAKVLKGEPVDDRYVLGLAWSIKQLEEARG